MGMAASQARFLALTARKSNCEFEGQQINQQRTSLANQSANLYNQMLGLKVPVPPSKSSGEFTKTVYSFTDSDGQAATIDSIVANTAANSADYGYIVRYRKDQQVNPAYRNDTRQIRAAIIYNNEKGSLAYSINGTSYALKRCKDTTYEKDFAAINAINAVRKAADPNSTDINPQKLYKYNSAKANEPPNWQYVLLPEDTSTVAPIKVYNSDGSVNTNAQIPDDISVSLTQNSNGGYDVTKAGKVQNFTLVTKPTGSDSSTADPDTSIFNFKHIDGYENGIILKYLTGNNSDGPIYNYVLLKDGSQSLKDAVVVQATPNKTDDVTNYDFSRLASNSQSDTYEAELKEVALIQQSKLNFDSANNTYSSSIDTSVTYPELIPVDTFNDYEHSVDEAQINKIMESYDSAGSADGEWFKYVDAYGHTVYVNLDVADNGQSAEIVGNYSYYIGTDTDTVDTEVFANMTKDPSGRWTGIQIQGSNEAFSISVNQITDEDAYNDAMNKYDYEKAQYDKAIEDINAKTALIHEQDRTLELRLKQLDTEHLAIQTELDALDKVIEKNVEKSFNTFS